MKNGRRRSDGERRLLEVGRKVVDGRKSKVDPWAAKGQRATSCGKQVLALQAGALQEIEDKYGTFERYLTEEERRTKDKERKETERLKAWLKKKLGR